MPGGLISNALSAGTGNGLITSALCMQNKKSPAKLIIHFDLYEVLNADLSGFYNTVTLLNRVDVEFAVLNASRDVIYTSPKNRYFTNDTAVELPNGAYTIKLLYSAYGFVGGEEQGVTVSGETVYAIKLYLRHFKAVTVIDESYETYHGGRWITTWYHHGNGEAGEVKCLSQIDIFELKWDKWVKVLNYNCVPLRLPFVATSFYSVEGKGTRQEDTFYVNGIVKSSHNISYNYNGTVGLNTQRNFRGFVATAQGKPYLDNVKYASAISKSGELPMFGETATGSWGSPETADASNYTVKNLVIAELAINLYEDNKNYEDTELDADFFVKYGGSVLFDNTGIGSTPQYFLVTDLQNYEIEKARYNIIKTYLPKVRFFDEEFEKERKKDKQHSGNLWNANIGFSNEMPVNVNENGVVTEYAGGITIFNELIISNINAIGSDSFAWYSDDFSQY